MYKIGVDITTVSRIKDSMEKGDFKNFVYSEKELESFYFIDKPKYSSLRANFAAKEAFSKALGTGIRNFSLDEVEILRDGLGKPYFNFYGKAAEIMMGFSAQVSLSHEGDTAIAMVLLERDKTIINL